MAKKILLVDDEPSIIKGLKYSLEQEGYTVDAAYDGQQAIDRFTSFSPDLILLDVMLPVFSGIEVCQKIRETSNVPIIMLTAKGEDMDKILGLEYGADDYMTKPFNILEVKARVKSIFRRIAGLEAGRKKEQSLLSFEELTLNMESRTAYFSGREITLTVKEFDMLAYFMQNPGKVLSREQLLDEIWDEYSGDLRTVDVHIRRLREKIEPSPAEPRYILTKWGVGYYFAEK